MTDNSGWWFFIAGMSTIQLMALFWLIRCVNFQFEKVRCKLAAIIFLRQQS